jgi:predicted amidophosphoribosyltransferase
MTMPPRLCEIGELERGDHFHLTDSDECWFWGEYTPFEHTDGKKWDYSPTNRLIFNFKKKKGAGGYQYKAEALDQIAGAFVKIIKWNKGNPNRTALIPMPPSKRRTDPDYDARMLNLLKGIEQKVGFTLDIRDCLSCDGSQTASHESQDRPTIETLFSAMSFNNQEGRPKDRPNRIVLFDDVLTTGAHFQAACRRLRQYFPDVPIAGIFIARVVRPN